MRSATRRMMGMGRRHRVAVCVGILLLAVTVAVPALGKPPSWDTVKKKASSRFKVLKAFSEQAVLDKETGLVWERTPSSGSACGSMPSWNSAIYCCAETVIGGRMGWRLPLSQELATLIDPTQVNPALPAGHPFTGVESDLYWTANSITNNTANALLRALYNGASIQAAKTASHRYWCVRGPGGFDLGN